MDALVVTWRELLIAGIIVLAVYAAEILLLTRSSANRGLRLWRRGAAAHAEHQETTALRNEFAGLRDQVTRLQQEIEQLKAAPGSTPQPTPYSQAIQLAQHGRNATEVAADCGISPGEAELIVALYRPRSS